MLNFEHPREQSNIIKVIGVGGGGSNAVSHMYHEGIKGVDFIVCNTDAQVLALSPISNKIHLGKRQLGAGNNPTVGREAALETTEEIVAMLETHTKMLFITAGMGGGTGTGAAPIVAEIARNLDILTVGIVTLPFSFEGRRRRQQALEGIEELRKHVDTLLIISNDKLREEYGDMGLTAAFKKADNVLTTASKGIAEIITVAGYVNVDFEDVKNVMKNSGKAIMGSGSGEGENRAIKAIEEAMRSPLLNDTNISGAKNVLLYINSGTDEVSLDEVHDIIEYVQNICGNSADIIWGNGEDPSLGSSISVSVVATGFSSNEIDIIPSMQNVTVRPLYETNANNGTNSPQAANQANTMEGHTFASKTKPGSFNGSPLQQENQPVKIHQLFASPAAVENSNLSEQKEPSIDALNKKGENPDKIEADEIFFEVTNLAPNKETVQPEVPFGISNSGLKQDAPIDQYEMERRLFERQARLKSMSLKIKTTDGLNELERQPAYLRNEVNINHQQEILPEFSRYSIDSKNNAPELKSNNSFLHDNVD